MISSQNNIQGSGFRTTVAAVGKVRCIGEKDKTDDTVSPTDADVVKGLF